MNGRRTDADESLVRIRDLAGRARGTGFLVDDRGTLVTSHEAVDGLARLVLHASGELTCVVGADDVIVLPECDLALVRTEGLVVPPLPVAAAPSVAAGKEVRLRAGRWQSARVVGDVPVTYTATDRFHLLGTALELSLSGREGLRLGEEATGGPVFDARTGAVVAVLGTALQAERRAAGFAIPLRAAAAAAPGGPLAALLDRNSATVPAFGPDLNLAGALQLTATALGSVVTPRVWREPVERPETEREFSGFLDGEGIAVLGGGLRGAGGREGLSGRKPAGFVLGLVGDPGTGRTTELGALAGRRARGAEPAPTLWLRGADLEMGDESVRDAVARALKAAGRIVAASAGAGGTVGDPMDATPEAVAELAARVGRPLLVLLDGPEEMPPVLAHALPAWTAATAKWLEESGSRMIVACRPEHWEWAGALFPREALHAPAGPGHLSPAAAALVSAVSGPSTLPPCARLTGLNPGQAAEARAAHGIPDEAIDPADAGHPLALRLLAEVRAALPDGTVGGSGEGEAAPDRWGVFAAYLDLVCLRIAVRLAASRRPPLRGAAVRRLAARVAGQVHEAARRCLGPGQGELEREAFEELFPWRTGWASAVLTEGLLVPAGTGYRFAHEEFADWLQGTHLDLDAALHALVHRWYEPEGPPAVAAVRLPSRAGGGPAPAPEGHVPPPPGSGSAARATAARRRKRGGAAAQEPPRPLPVPRHRIGPVLQALLLLARRSGPTELSRRLSALVHAVETLAQRPPERDETTGSGSPGGRCVSDPSWWAAHLLGEALLRVPDATPYMGVLRLLAERVTARSVAAGGFDGDASRALGGLAEFGPWFWLRLPLGLAERLELLRILIPADGPPPGASQAPPPALEAAGSPVAGDAAGAAEAQGAADARGAGAGGTEAAGRSADGESGAGAEADNGRGVAREGQSATGGPVGAAGRKKRGAGRRSATGGQAGAAGQKRRGAKPAAGWSAADWFGTVSGTGVGRNSEEEAAASAAGAADHGDSATSDVAGGPGERTRHEHAPERELHQADGGARPRAVWTEPEISAQAASRDQALDLGGWPDREPSADTDEPIAHIPAQARTGSPAAGAAPDADATDAAGQEGDPAAAAAPQGPAEAAGDPDAGPSHADAPVQSPDASDPKAPVAAQTDAPAGLAATPDHSPAQPSGAPAAGQAHAAVPPQGAQAPITPRFLTAVAGLLMEYPCAAQPLLCRWFSDERLLQTVPDVRRVRPTVAAAAQALLHTHRRRAIDDLAEALVDAAHPRADELLAALAEDEPSALCRAVDRWAHDDRVERHVAAAAYGLKTAPHVTTTADRDLLRFAALALLERSAASALHGTALSLLVRDPATRDEHLVQALARFASGDPHLPPGVLAPALATHPEPVLAAFRARLFEPGDGPAEVLRTLAGVSVPALARRAAALVHEHVEHHPEGAANAAEFVDRRLEEGPTARAVLFPLVVDLLRTRPPRVRRALAPVLAAPGTPASRPLRQELLEVLMEREEYGPNERDVTVLDALLRAVAEGAAERSEARTRDLVHRTGLLMARTPEGAACFDRRLTQLAREVPVFGEQVRGWLRSAPAQWAVVVGPSARIRLTAGREKTEANSPDLTVTAPADAERRQPAWHS